MEAQQREIAAAAARDVARDRGLARAVGTWGLSTSIVNGVVGAGIFALPAAMAAAAGTRAPLAFLACIIAMGAVVACFAEAGSRVPTSGGPYGYVETAFGPAAGFVAGVLLWVASVLSCGGILAALVDALAAFAPGLGAALPRTLFILIVIAAIGWMHIRGVGIATRLISWATVIKLVPLALFLLVGGYALGTMAGPAPAPVPVEADFGRAVILAFFALCGMETPLAASGEVERPARTIPRALVGAMLFIALLYIAIQIVAQGLLGPALAGSAAPLADAMTRVSPALGVVLLAGTALSMLTWIGSDVLGAPRVLFAFARDGMLPAWLGAVHPRYRTPHRAIALHSALAGLLAISGTFVQLAILSTLATAGLYFLGCAGAWRLRSMGLALLGEPLGLRGLPLAALIGMASMVLLVLQARGVEIIGFLALIAVSVAFYACVRLIRARSRSAGPCGSRRGCRAR